MFASLWYSEYNFLAPCSPDLNLAVTSLKLKSWDSACASASKALTLDGGNVKALYRRAQAYMNLGQHAAALEDLKAACEMEPKNRTIRNVRMLSHPLNQITSVLFSLYLV